MHKFARRLGLIVVCSLVALSVASPAWGDLIPFPGPGDMEFSLETDKSAYSLGEQVHATYYIHNPTDQEFEWEISDHPGFYLWAFKGNSEIWTSRHVVLPAFWTLRILPHETFEREMTWDLTDSNSFLVTLGQYVLTAGIAPNNDEAASAPITVVPEPVTTLLLASAWIPLLLKRRQRR